MWSHFMGKKSVTGSPHLETPEEPAVPMVFSPSLRSLMEDMMELLTRELLKILLQERLLDENQGKYDLTDQQEIKRDKEYKGKGISQAKSFGSVSAQLGFLDAKDTKPCRGRLTSQAIRKGGKEAEKEAGCHQEAKQSNSIAIPHAPPGKALHILIWTSNPDLTKRQRREATHLCLSASQRAAHHGPVSCGKDSWARIHRMGFITTKPQFKPSCSIVPVREEDRGVMGKAMGQSDSWI
ncbi:hypothetical protein IHE44_0002577 [Lamprotornis superbus]|uniref:Uncharacterized protein n=1 Tax=Lamprotornis superbus TaxID=245042 RepID=A0A835NJI3_9PASS|nr:hypothetical protein IHE44_0002577 [Lamprotornis superbus]